MKFSTSLLALLFGTGFAFPRCKEGDMQIEKSCDILASEGGLSWAPYDFQWPKAQWQNHVCRGELAGVRCLAGSGFTSRRYNVWECMESCQLPDDGPNGAEIDDANNLFSLFEG